MVCINISCCTSLDIPLRDLDLLHMRPRPFFYTRAYRFDTHVVISVTFDIRSGFC